MNTFIRQRRRKTDGFEDCYK